jgi:hypothetical protein
MKSTDYPRMMFHRMLPPVTVQNEEEEAALGPEWSRIVQAQALPEEQKPAKPPHYEPEPEDEPLVDPDEEPEEQPDEEQPQKPAALKPRRARPPAPMSKHKRKL